MAGIFPSTAPARRSTFPETFPRPGSLSPASLARRAHAKLNFLGLQKMPLSSSPRRRQRPAHVAQRLHHSSHLFAESGIFLSRQSRRPTSRLGLSRNPALLPHCLV